MELTCVLCYEPDRTNLLDRLEDGDLACEDCLLEMVAQNI